MEHSAEMLRCLSDLDIEGARRLWAHIAPHMPQPRNDGEALYTLHLARMQSKLIPPKLKAYSKAWLKGYDQRKIVSAVGIAVKTNRPQAIEARMAMECAVIDSIRAGICIDEDAGEVRRRILRARSKIIRE